MSRNRRIHELLDRFASEEERFLHREFLAPTVPGGVVHVRLGGVACRIRTAPRDYRGFGVFEPISFNEAVLQRDASLAERRRYLDQLPKMRLVLCRRCGGRWLAAAAHQGDRRIQLHGLAPVHLVEEAQAFDMIIARFDGARFWFDDVDASHDPATSAYLRWALLENVDPEQIKRPGLTPEERSVYAIAYWKATEPAVERRRRTSGRTRGGQTLPPFRAAAPTTAARRLHEALSRAGGSLIDYLEHPDVYRVSYLVDGRQHTSAVSKQDLTVVSAGICLEEMDAAFDLQSLVGVIREGTQRGETYRFD